MSTGTQRTISHRLTTLEGFQSSALANGRARKEKFAGLKDRMFERMRERKPLNAKTAPLEEKEEVVLEKRKSGLLESAEVVGIAAACALTCFALGNQVVGTVFALGGAVTAVYGAMEFISESRQLERIREEIASIREKMA